VVITIVPLAPTAQQEFVGQETARSWFVVPDVWGDHDEPSAVARIVPPPPTAQHEVVEGHATPRSAYVVPELSLDQVDPPFDVVRIVPLFPTAKQFVDDGHLTQSS
jgi:hypothetical protein